ncbi:peptidyl-tRNA hydrolase 2, mitochondrial-like [Hydra vulgaris]|uniref:peptidyl-tRNA hydrolase 2, mitochondrial-like n=1 Tax=Hydra vulgaris TaxID=6087 RepID=UPI0001924DAE|nr:peptidyl-tRNA hydrolase 2, mitochondrial-like [Hydra vulgaris]
MSAFDLAKTNEPSSKYVMYILVNNDLRMSKGKISAQVGHVVGVITEEILTNAFVNPSKESLEDYKKYKLWTKDDKFAKIVLRAQEKDLINFIGTEKKRRYIIDQGVTQIKPGSLTVVGFYPSNDMSEKFKMYKLL